MTKYGNTIFSHINHSSPINLEMFPRVTPARIPAERLKYTFSTFKTTSVYPSSIHVMRNIHHTDCAKSTVNKYTTKKSSNKTNRINMCYCVLLHRKRQGTLPN